MNEKGKLPMDGGIDCPEQWLELHGSVLYRYALSRLRDEHKAEEVVQETLLAALQARERFSGDATVRTWMIGILKHKILDQFRRESREVALDDPDGLAEDDDIIERSFLGDGHWAMKIADWGDPEKALENGQFWAVLEFCLERMPERHARLFLMRELQGESTEIICAHFGISAANLWTIFYRARVMLRQCMESHFK